MQNMRRTALLNKAKDMHETSQGKGCTEVPLQVQGSEKMKLEVPGSVRAWLKVKNNYKNRGKVQSSGTAGARQ